MSKHTPGPWSFDTHGVDMRDGFAGIEISPDELSTNGGSSICECWGDDKLANAHLIVAAPELLKMLKLVVNDPSYDGMTATKKAIKAVIERAAGKNP